MLSNSKALILKQNLAVTGEIFKAHLSHSEFTKSFAFSIWPISYLLPIMTVDQNKLRVPLTKQKYPPSIMQPLALMYSLHSSLWYDKCVNITLLYNHSSALGRSTFHKLTKRGNIWGVRYLSWKWEGANTCYKASATLCIFLGAWESLHEYIICTCWINLYLSWCESMWSLSFCVHQCMYKEAKRCLDSLCAF